MPLDKAIENLENSFLFWDEKALSNFVREWLKTIFPKGGDSMIKKGLCETCIYDKTCGYPRKFPVHACDEFTPDKKKSPRNAEKCDVRE